MKTIETTLQWRKANDRPDHNCRIIVLVEDPIHNYEPTCYTTSYYANWGEDVTFLGKKVIGWAELNFEDVKTQLTSNFDTGWIVFLHNNACQSKNF